MKIKTVSNVRIFQFDKFFNAKSEPPVLLTFEPSLSKVFHFRRPLVYISLDDVTKKNFFFI
jgi:hypothetical protein